MRLLTDRSRRPAPGPGQESAWDYPRPPRVERSGRRWVNEQPAPGYEAICDHLALYGGWITSDVLGPFKGAPGTIDW